MTSFTTDIADLKWHTLTIDQVAERLSVALTVGLESTQVDRKVKEHGKNEITPPSKNILKKIFKYIFGGFGPLLLGAAILCFIAWYASFFYSHSIPTHTTPTPDADVYTIFRNCLFLRPLQEATW